LAEETPCQPQVLFCIAMYFQFSRCCSALLLLLASASAADVNVTVLVVGKVSTSSANILLELDGASSEIEILCGAAPQSVLTLEAAGGALYAVSHSVNCSLLGSRRPVVFFFDALPAATQFQVTLAPGISSKHPARVLTHSSSQDNISIGVVSCNKHSFTLEEVPSGEDLWQPLADMVRMDEVNGVLHVGDQVYIDNDRHMIVDGAEPTNGRTTETIMEWCPWCRAEELLKDVPSSDWSTHADDIKESFRDIYRKTWGHGPTAYVLANSMNLFMVDDHSMRDDMGDNEEDRNPSSMDFFLASLAFEVAWEYQYALMGPWDTPLAQAYHTYKLANGIGMFFLDTRVARSVLYVPGSPTDETLLQAQQWDDLRSALAADGSMSSVNLLLVVAPVPLVYTTEQANNVLITQVDDFKGAWAAFPEEQNSVLTLLKSWQAAREGRKVVVVAGDVHHGGHTVIYNQGEDVPLFEQLTTSAISNRAFSSTEQTAMTLMQNVFESLEDFRFRHHGWTYQRNFGTLDVQLPSSGSSEPPAVVQRLYVTDGAGGATVVSTYTDGTELENSVLWWVYVVIAASSVCCCCCCGGICWYCHRFKAAAGATVVGNSEA